VEARRFEDLDFGRQTAPTEARQASHPETIAERSEIIWTCLDLHTLALEVSYAVEKVLIRAIHHVDDTGNRDGSSLIDRVTNFRQVRNLPMKGIQLSRIRAHAASEAPEE
jgi:hypothetical protein